MTKPTADASTRTQLVKVAVPSEHGGWSLTLEPAVLGLIVAPSWAGAALGAAALLGFLVRTPLKISLGDRRRHRRLPRTALADRVVAAETTALIGLLAIAAGLAEQSFWLPLALATPMFLVGLWFDIRSKSRHLLPELAGTIGIGSVATAIAHAGGADTVIAWGLWAIVAARAIAAIPFIRVELRRAKGQPFRLADSDGAQAAAVGLIAATTIAAATSLVAAVAIVGLAAVHVVEVRRPPLRAAMLGAQQVVLGLAVVFASGLAAIAP